MSSYCKSCSIYATICCSREEEYKKSRNKIRVTLEKNLNELDREAPVEDVDDFIKVGDL